MSQKHSVKITKGLFANKIGNIEYRIPPGVLASEAIYKISFSSAFSGLFKRSEFTLIGKGKTNDKANI